MKVVHLCTYSSGGAAIAATRLHKGLLEKGVDSSIVFLYRNRKDIPHSFDFRDSLPFLPRMLSKFRNKLLTMKQQKKISQIGIAPEFFSFPQSVWDIAKHPLMIQADIVHLHWMAGFIDYRFFKDPVLTGKKICWTLHDLQPFSGGFHYEDWFDTLPWKDLEVANLAYKSKQLENIPLTLVAPSRWIMERSRNSAVFSGKEHVHIPNPPSTEFFYKGKEEARRNMRLPSGRKICFIPGDHTDYERKGIKRLEELLQREKLPLLFLSTGERRPDLGKNEQLFLGQLRGDKMMMCYHASDVTLQPSLDENFSNVLVESLLCGCPVICFRLGGNPEIVRNSASGSLIPKMDMYALKEALLDPVKSEEERRRLATSAAADFSGDELLNKMIQQYRIR